MSLPDDLRDYRAPESAFESVCAAGCGLALVLWVWLFVCAVFSW